MAGLLAGPVITTAPAQDALGRGDALDANPGVGTGLRNVRLPSPDYRARNLLVTGDVAGGRGFRDSVGYFADTDFRGALGSDDLFQFRADAAYSSPRLAGLGRVADSFRYGQDLAMHEFRRMASGAAPSRLPDGRDDFALRLSEFPDETRISAQRFDEFVTPGDLTALMHMQDSTTRWDVRRPVGLTFDDEGDPYLISVSPLRGLSMVDAPTHMASEGISEYDLARLQDDAMQQRLAGPVGAAYSSGFGDLLRRDERVTQEPADSRVESSRIAEPDSPYVEVLQRIAQRYAGADEGRVVVDASVLAELDEEFDDLRETLRARRFPRAGEADGERAAEGDLMPWMEDDEQLERQFDPRRDVDDLQRIPRRPWRQPREGEPEPDERDLFDPRDRARDLMPPRREREIDPGRDEDEPARPRDDDLTLDERIDLLRHGHIIDGLVPDDGSRINELNLSAESALRRGHFLTAESRFARALRLSRDHPMASIGMAHAQFGAGLFRSAAITLRSAFSSHPELIDVRYGRTLLPGESRLAEIHSELRDQLDDPDLGPFAGLVLSYLGHHGSDRAMVQEGLRAMEAADADDPLLPIIRGVWLAEDVTGDE